jgi:uncharacterized lipoprotein YddW (UPF0748 family)
MRLISRRTMARMRILAVFLGLLPATLFAAGEVYRPLTVTPPPPPREFRGVWIATVANIDWPSRPGLGVGEQKAELTALLDRAAQLKLNAVVFQVRPACDALYASSLEPWSEYLTGRMGRAPDPFYDPLAFAIDQAHRRGLELHAWFNPFRAWHPRARSTPSPNHISRSRPQLVRRYGDQLWLDPGDPAVREYVLSVVADVVRRYDVDGVQFDDYFYPDPQKDAAGRDLEFPDTGTWQRFGLAGGFANRDDWRRANINQFIQSTYQSIKALKPWVKFGISAKGIWRPGNPPPIQGMDAYAKIYGDSRKWLVNGWLDYFAPQLYWPIAPREQSFPVLLKWWAEQNAKGRLLCPGIAAYRAEIWKPDEIPQQIRIARAQPGVSGCIFYSMNSLMKNAALAAVLRREFAAQTALQPAMPWLDSRPPDKPVLAVSENGGPGLSVRWESAGEPAWQWVLQYRTNENWTTEILPARQTARVFADVKPDLVAVSAVDRAGNLGAAAAIKKVQPMVPGRATMDWNTPQRPKW